MIEKIKPYVLNSHTLYTLAIMLVALFFNITLITAWTMVVFWYSRELVDAQNKAGIDRAKTPFKNALPWQWHEKSRIDYFAPLFVCVAFSVLDILSTL